VIYLLPEPLAIVPGTTELLQHFLSQTRELRVAWARVGRTCATYLGVPDDTAALAEKLLLPVICQGTEGQRAWRRIPDVPRRPEWTLGCWLDPYEGAEVLSLINVQSALLQLSWKRQSCAGTLLYSEQDADFCGDLARHGWRIRPVSFQSAVKGDRGPRWGGWFPPTVTAALPWYIRLPEPAPSRPTMTQSTGKASQPEPPLAEPGHLMSDEPQPDSPRTPTLGPPLPPPRPPGPLPPLRPKDVSHLVPRPEPLASEPVAARGPAPGPSAASSARQEVRLDPADDLFLPYDSDALPEPELPASFVAVLDAIRERADRPTHPAAAVILEGWREGLKRDAMVKQVCGAWRGPEAEATRRALDHVLVPHVLAAQGDDLLEVVFALLLATTAPRERYEPSEAVRRFLQQLSGASVLRGGGWQSALLRAAASIQDLLGELGLPNPLLEPEEPCVDLFPPDIPAIIPPGAVHGCPR
jgi:hypothetical protein